MVTISGRDVISKLNVDSQELKISKGPNVDQAYYRARYDGIGFTVNTDFYQSWKAGKIAEVNLVESSYQVDDPENPDVPITRKSWQLSAYATIDQVLMVEQNEHQLELTKRKGKIQLKKMEYEELKDLELDEETVKSILQAQ